MFCLSFVSNDINDILLSVTEIS